MRKKVTDFTYNLLLDAAKGERVSRFQLHGDTWVTNGFVCLRLRFDEAAMFNFDSLRLMENAETFFEGGRAVDRTTDLKAQDAGTLLRLRCSEFDVWVNKKYLDLIDAAHKQTSGAAHLFYSCKGPTAPVVVSLNDAPFALILPVRIKPD